MKRNLRPSTNCYRSSRRWCRPASHSSSLPKTSKARHSQLGALARSLPLDYYAFPTVGVPRYSPLGPGIDVDNATLFAIIRQESAFDPSDWSHAQAMGLARLSAPRFSLADSHEAAAVPIQPWVIETHGSVRRVA